MATQSEENVRRLREQFDAMDRHDIDGATSYYAEDAVLTDHATQETCSGYDEIRAYLASQFEPFPDLRVEEVDTFAGGDWTVFRGIGRGTHDGRLAGLEATNRPIEFSFCNPVRWQDGKIVEDHAYYDMYAILVQIGHVSALSEMA